MTIENETSSIQEVLSDYQKKRSQHIPTNIYLIIENAEDTPSINSLDVWTHKKDWSEKQLHSFTVLADRVKDMILSHSINNSKS